MRYFKNSRGQVFRSGVGGTYPVNNGDPQNDDDEAPEADEIDTEDDAIAFAEQCAEEKAGRDNERY